MSEASPRYVTAQAVLTRERIGRSPQLRQETVAHHYVSLAQMALEMHELIKLRRYSPSNESADELIHRLEGLIAQAHHEAFGDWPTWWFAPEGLE